MGLCYSLRPRLFGDAGGGGSLSGAAAEPEPPAEPPKLHPRPPLPAAFVLEAPGGAPASGGLRDDRSCSVLQMAKTLSEVEYGGGGGGGGRAPAPPLPKGRLELPPRCLHPDYGRPLAFPPHPIRESIEEDLAEEALCQAGRGGPGESSVGEWLRALGLERYEQGLVHNGWDDLEFLSDITEEDLEEAGVLDPSHKRVLLESLQLRK